MTFTEEQIEWIVVEVIRRLGLLSSHGSQDAVNTHEVRLAEPVVTMQVVSGRLTGVKRLVVSKRAVITPAVKDELKKRHVELVREA
jgi:hypothetical protein